MEQSLLQIQQGQRVAECGDSSYHHEEEEESRLSTLDVILLMVALMKEILDSFFVGCLLSKQFTLKFVFCC